MKSKFAKELLQRRIRTSFLDDILFLDEGQTISDVYPSAAVLLKVSFSCEHFSESIRKEHMFGKEKTVYAEIRLIVLIWFPPDIKLFIPRFSPWFDMLDIWKALHLKWSHLAPPWVWMLMIDIEIVSHVSHGFCGHGRLCSICLRCVHKFVTFGYNSTDWLYVHPSDQNFYVLSQLSVTW